MVGLIFSYRWVKQQYEQQFKQKQAKQTSKKQKLTGGRQKQKLTLNSSNVKKKQKPTMAIIDSYYSVPGPDLYGVAISVAGTIPTNNATNSGKSMAQRKFQDGDSAELAFDIHTVGAGIIPAGAVGEVIEYDGNYYKLRFHSYGGVEAWLSSSRLKVTNKPTKDIVEFDSVVTTEENRQQILEVLEQANQSDLIFKEWGFSKTIEKGRGISVLFYGPPGTGKTLMAQAIADKLGRELKIIGVADVMSSEPGAAERTIRDLFKHAKPDRTILLFDECDSLIYDRTAVGAILGATVNELLSSLEKFEGITVFTTNRLGTLDEAFNRRLALKLEFAMPDAAARAEIWKRMIPKECPTADDIDFELLAAIEITGGYIKNTVLRAARIAAAEDKPNQDKKLSHAHLLRALKEESESMVAFMKAKRDFDPVRMVGPSVGMGSNYSLEIKRNHKERL